LQPTVGVDFVSKTIMVENKNLRMQLWDTAGQERFHSLIPSYIKDCHAAVIVFDLTSILNFKLDVNSFNNLNKWIDNVREVRGE
jgi:small GTP-binding protein